MIFHFYFQVKWPLRMCNVLLGQIIRLKILRKHFSRQATTFFQKKSQSHLFAQEVSFLVTLQSSSSTPKKTKMSPACKRLKFRWPAALFWNTASSSVFFFPNDGPPRRKSPSFVASFKKNWGVDDGNRRQLLNEFQVKRILLWWQEKRESLCSGRSRTGMGGLVPGYRTSVLTLILSYPQNRDAKDWAAGNGRLNYCIVQSSIVHCFDGIPLKH